MPRMKIITLDEAAEKVGLAPRTLRRLIAAGDGPPTITVSPRKQVIAERDFAEWLSTRRVTAPNNERNAA